MKSKTALAERNRPALLAALSELDGAGNIHLVEKSYFVTAKLVDVTLSPDGSPGLAGLARQWADTLHTFGPTAVGEERWIALLATFNQLIRSYLRAGSVAPTTQPFFDALDDAVRSCTDPRVSAVLVAIWQGRRLVSRFEGASPLKLREIDPMGPALTAVGLAWRLRLGDVPIEFVADNYGGLTLALREAIVAASRAPLAIAGVQFPRPDLRDIRVVDSRNDLRVQVADVLGGVGREIARLAEDGTFDDELQIASRDLLDYNAMCSAGSAIDTLIDRHIPRYLAEAVRREPDLRPLLPLHI